MILEKSEKSLFTNNLIINFSNDNALYYGGGEVVKGIQNIMSKRENIISKLTNTFSKIQ